MRVIRVLQYESDDPKRIEHVLKKSLPQGVNDFGDIKVTIRDLYDDRWKDPPPLWDRAFALIMTGLQTARDMAYYDCLRIGGKTKDPTSRDTLLEGD